MTDDELEQARVWAETDAPYPVKVAPGDVNENTQMLISIKEWARLHEVEDAAKAAYPRGRWVVYFRPNAPRLKALRAALYRTD